MSGLQDENGFSAGGGTQGGGTKQSNVPQVSRPDPAAVRATVEQQIATAKQAAAAAKKAAKTGFSAKVSELVDNSIDAAAEAHYTRLDGIDSAAVPVLDQQRVIADIEAQLRQAKLELNAKKVVFKAAKGELKSAYKQAVSGIWETTRADIEAAKSAREQAVIAAKEALTEARNKGANTVQEEEALADAYDNWQSDMKWAGRKAGFNAVAQTVVAIVNAAKEVYKEAAAAERAAVPVPAALLKGQSEGPAPSLPSA